MKGHLAGVNYHRRLLDDDEKQGEDGDLSWSRLVAVLLPPGRHPAQAARNLCRSDKPI